MTSNKSQEYFDKFQAFQEGTISESEWKEYATGALINLLSEMTQPTTSTPSQPETGMWGGSK